VVSFAVEDVLTAHIRAFTQVSSSTKALKYLQDINKVVNPVNLLKKIDRFFLIDEVDEEFAPALDRCIFYGMLATAVIGIIYFIYKIITIEKDIQKENEDINGVSSKLDNILTMFNLNIESMKNMQVLLADLALDTEEKYYYGLDKYFLWDNNDKLQVVADLMFRVVMESKEEYQEIEDLKNKLFELTKVGVIDED